MRRAGRIINITAPDLGRFFCVWEEFKNAEVDVRLSEPLRASAQHIELLQGKRRRLSDALVSAELQFLAALRRECRDDEMTWAQLRDAYSVLSAGRLPGLRARWMDAISVSPEDVILNARQEAALLSAELQFLATLRRAYQGGEMTWAQLREAHSVLSAGRLPGLRACWMDAVPVSPEDVILNARREAAGGAGGTWRGHRPLHPGEYYPPIGQWVVYVLFDAGRHPVYVRTTNRCSQRFTDHRAQGKRWSSWTAYAIDSAEAHEVQARLMRRYQTDLNRQRAPA
jgi:hypothetical protein